jgi:glucokinase
VSGAESAGPAEPGDDARVSEEVVAAIDFGGTKTAVALADRSGSIIARRVFDTPGGASHRQAEIVGGSADSAPQSVAAERAVAEAIAAVDNLRGSRQLRGLGVVSPGVVTAGGIRLAPHVDGWENLRLPELFESAFPGVPATFGNDVKAAALAESTIGELRGADPGVFVNLGTGVAMATVVAGRVLTGAHGWAGEVGYSPGVGPDGERAPVEQLVGGAALQRLAAHEMLPSTAALIDHGLTDPALGRRIVASFDALADGLIAWCLVIDPQRIVVSGGLLAASALWWKPVEARLADALPDPPVLRRSAFEADAALQGAVLLSLRAARSRTGEPAVESSR